MDLLTRQHIAPPGAGRTPLHVLVVDDVPMNRAIAAAFLRADGHVVTSVASGEDAVTATADRDFDAVLMDVQLRDHDGDGIDGLEAARQIRRHPDRRGRVPILALTGAADESWILACARAGMNGHIAKPFNQPDLLGALRRAVSAKPGAGPTWPPMLDHAAFDHAAALMDADDLRDCLDALHARGRSMLRLLRGPSGDDAAWRLAAHTMAGSTGLLGFHDAAAAAGRLERACDPVAADRPDRALAAAAMARAVDAMLPEIRHLQGDTAP